MPRSKSVKLSERLFAIAIVIDAVGTGLFMPLSLLYFTKITDLELSTVGLMVSAANILTLPLPLLAGKAVDRFGARPVVVAAMWVQAIGFAGYVVVTGPVMVMTAVAVVAMGGRMFWSSIFSFNAELAAADKGDRASDKWFANLSMVQVAGFSLGGLAGGALLATESESTYRLLALGNALTFVFAAVLISFFVKTAGRQEKEQVDKGGYAALLSDRPYQAYILINTLFVLCSVFLGVAIPVYVVEALPAPDWTVGPLLAVNSVLLSIGARMAVRAVRPLNRIQGLMLAGGFFTLWAAGCALAVVVPAGFLFPYLIMVTLLYTAAELIHAPVSNALAADAAPEHSRGRYLAVFQYCFTFAHIIVPGLFSVLFDASPTLPWIVMGVAAFAGTLAVGLLQRRLPRAAVEGTGPADESEAAGDDAEPPVSTAPGPASTDAAAPGKASAADAR